MILLALVPPLFYHVMDPMVHKINAQKAVQIEDAEGKQHM